MATTTWISQTPGATVTESLLTQVQSEAAAAELSADEAAASAVAAAVSAAAAAVSASAASTSASAASTSAVNALTYANQALAAAASVTSIPSGGLTGQSLVKNSSANYDYAWATVSGGGGGGLVDGDYGDITVSSSASVFTIDNGAITNAKVSASAAIAYSKLALTGAILNADLAGSIAYSKLSLTGAILNADLAGSIADTKLSTIATSGKVSNSATTATAVNTASAIVARDASNNFAAGTITAALTGNASTATTLQTARTINGVSFNGSANITVTAAADTLTGTTLPALNGAALTNLNGSAIASGTVPAANLGSGSSISTKFLRGDNTWQTISGGGDALTSGNLSQFAATTSAQLLGVISDETGSGALVFGTAPTLTGVTLAGAVTGADQEVRAVTHRDTAYYRSAPTISAGAITFDYTAGPFFSVALNAAITSITLSNPPASGTVGVITIRFTADGTVRAITWPASVRWGTAGAPSAMTGTNGKVDYVQLITVDGGTTWDAFLNGQNF